MFLLHIENEWLHIEAGRKDSLMQNEYIKKEKSSSNGLKIAGALAVVIIFMIIGVIIYGSLPTGRVAKLLSRGYEELEKQEYREAKSIFEQVLEIDDECIEAYAGSIKAYQGLEKEEELIELYEDVLDVFEDMDEDSLDNKKDFVTWIYDETETVFDGSEETEAAVNENDNILMAYEEFLNNERTVVLDSRYDEQWYVSNLGLEHGQEYYMSDILQSVNTFFLEESFGNTKMKEVNWAYLDCGADGKQELALQFCGLDIYSKDDDSDAVCVIRYEDDRLILCYAFESWARSSTELFYYGMMSSYGSGGATHGGGDQRILDETGKCEQIYALQHEYDISFLESDPAYGSAVEWYWENGEELPQILVETYTIAGEDYYKYNIYSEDADEYLCFDPQINDFFGNVSAEEFYQKAMEVSTIFADRGACSESRIEELLENNLQNMGLEEQLTEAVPLEWMQVDNSIYTEYLR